MTALGVQVGEGGGSASGVDDLGFDPNDVIKFEVQLTGSGGIDTFVFVPEPSTALLMGLGLAGFGLRRRV